MQRNFRHSGSWLLQSIELLGNTRPHYQPQYLQLSPLSTVNNCEDICFNCYYYCWGPTIWRFVHMWPLWCAVIIFFLHIRSAQGSMWSPRASTIHFDKKQTHNADMVQRYDNTMHLKHFLKLHAQLQFISAYARLSSEARIEGYPSNTTLYHHHVFRV